LGRGALFEGFVLYLAVPIAEQQQVIANLVTSDSEQRRSVGLRSFFSKLSNVGQRRIVTVLNCDEDGVPPLSLPVAACQPADGDSAHQPNAERDAHRLKRVAFDLMNGRIERVFGRAAPAFERAFGVVHTFLESISHILFDAGSLPGNSRKLMAEFTGSFHYVHFH
jgi:hypothetical protein